MTAPIRIADPETTNWNEVLRLIQSSFAYMEARQGFPPAVNRLKTDDLKAASEKGPVLLMQSDKAILGCLFCRPSRDFPDALYVGWLAVAQEYRGEGAARALLEEAGGIATDKGFSALTLDTGASLGELHRTFRKCGFEMATNKSNNRDDVITMTRQL